MKKDGDYQISETVQQVWLVKFFLWLPKSDLLLATELATYSV